MASCLYFFQGSKTLLALLVPVLAVFARFSSGHGAFLISITFSALVILWSSIILITLCKPKPIMVIKEAPIAGNESSPQEKQQPSSVQDNTLISSPDSDFGAVPSFEAKPEMKKAITKDDRQVATKDLCSESESMDQFSTTSSEDHSSDLEWPYNMGQRLDCSDDSISDEESLIEIAIPTGQFVSPLKDFKCCKLTQDFPHQESMFQKDFWADINEMNEEDNLIEIDIYMGSIKCSSFDI